MLRKGALAVVGHVDRAWGYSFITSMGNPDHQEFRKTLMTLLNGEKIGVALDDSFDIRYADMSSQLSQMMEDLHWDQNAYPAEDLAHLWTANNDARGYIIIGDPAVHIPFAEQDAEITERPSLDTALDYLPEYLKTTYSAITTDLAKSGGAPAAAESAGDAGEAAKSFGWFDGKDDKGEKGGGGEKAEGGPLQALQTIATNLAKKIGAALEEISSLEVNTYTSSDLEGVVYNVEEKRFRGALKMRARTYIAFDGDMEVCLPVREDGGVDRELWQIHSEMVKQAQANRTEFLKTLADLAARLVSN
jgi:hypothetical protein